MRGVGGPQLVAIVACYLLTFACLLLYWSASDVYQVQIAPQVTREVTVRKEQQFECRNSHQGAYLIADDQGEMTAVCTR